MIVGCIFHGPKDGKPGDWLVFADMAICSMVKDNTFNGMPLSAIVLKEAHGRLRLLRRFGYDDFKVRLV